MISTIALVLFFLMLLSYVQNIITGTNLKTKEEELRLANADIQETKAELMILEDQLDELNAEIDEGQRILQLSLIQMSEQQKIIANSNRELAELRMKLDQAAALRLEVLEAVKYSIEDELQGFTNNGESVVSIGENGNIILNSSVLFAPSSTVITEDGQALLAKLADAFENILDDEDIRQYIDVIEIQGHTDKRPDMEPNRKLSTDRAAAVTDYMAAANPNLEAKYGEYIAASGYSEYRPIDPAETEEAWAQNRRIEIAIGLKDPNLQQMIDDYLNGTDDFLGIASNSSNESTDESN
jgi:chemotaxis protein MotB